MLGANLSAVYDAPVQAMLLAAGLGTRLKPLTDQLPKPIVPVANRPLAAFAMDRLVTAGVQTIVANTHPDPERVERILAAHCPKGADIRFSREASLLGTGGGLSNARPLFPQQDEPVVVMNGDTLFAADLGFAYRRHVETGAVATMILRPTSEPERFGAIGIDQSGWVMQLLGAPPTAPVARQLMFTGVHILSPEAFAAMPASGCVIRSAYRGWVDQGAPVLGVVDESPWADLGTVAEYHRVNLELASGSLSWPGISSSDGNLIASGVALGGATIRRSVVGADVGFEAGASLDRCVVWPDTHVRGTIRDAVCTPQGCIELS